jgi:hypothetical protein
MDFVDIDVGVCGSVGGGGIRILIVRIGIRIRIVRVIVVAVLAQIAGKHCKQ